MTELALEAPSEFTFNPFDPAFHADPYAQYRQLRDIGPIQRTPFDLWISPSYATCSQVLRDNRFGHGDDHGDDPKWGESSTSRPFLLLNPPAHTRLRRLFSKAFTPRLAEQLRPRTQQVVDELLDDAMAAGEVDLITALAYPLPVILISELLGVPPEDRERFKGWSDALSRGLDPDFLLTPEDKAGWEPARIEFMEFFRELAARRRAEPTDDLLSGLVKVEEQGDVLSEDELLMSCILVLLAGHETTVNLIGNGALALLRHPEQLAYFRDNPAAGPGAIEELLRYDPPVQVTGRVALDDVEVSGVQISRGELVMLLLGAANRDPQTFADPDRLDLTRRADKHLAFGLGIHFCLGAALARIEGELALSTLVRRAPNLRLATEDLEYKGNLILRGLKELPVCLR